MSDSDYSVGVVPIVYWEHIFIEILVLMFQVMAVLSGGPDRVSAKFVDDLHVLW